MIRQLFCFPHSGASAAPFGRWRRLLPEVELRPVELPGHGRRIDEPLFDDMPPLVARLVDELCHALRPPFALLGHSLGALLAFELAHALRERGLPAPAALFASGTAAPGRRDDSEFAVEKSDAELVEHLRRFQGTSEAVLAESELMRLALPVLRADFRMCGRYRHRARPRLDCPIHVLGGRDDTATAEQLEAWREESRGGFSRTMFDGGHFFLFRHEAATVGLVRQLLSGPALPRAAVA